MQNQLALSPVSWSNSVGSDVRTHFAWVLCPNSSLLGPRSAVKFLGSWIWRQLTCVLPLDSKLLGLEFLNIIICVTNIIMVIIIKSIHFKNSIIFIINNIIFIIIESINIKNSIICVINIIILIIILSINIKNIIICVINILGFLNIIIFLIIQSIYIKNIIICVINILFLL